MIKQYNIQLSQRPRGFHLITTEILKSLGELPKIGILHLFIQHTSAGLSINENCAPSVRVDFETSFNRLAPEDPSLYTHLDEGSDDMPAHIKSSLTGHEISIPITEHKLNIGTWQGIYLCEFRNIGGPRNIVASIYQ
jgi:secondary thiamine-phosphate synthase enzyme